MGWRDGDWFLDDSSALYLLCTLFLLFLHQCHRRSSGIGHEGWGPLIYSVSYNRQSSIQIPGLHSSSPCAKLSSLSVFIHWVPGAYTKIQDHFWKDTQENDNRDHLLVLREKNQGNFAFCLYLLCHCWNICHEHALNIWFKNTCMRGSKIHV